MRNPAPLRDTSEGHGAVTDPTTPWGPIPDEVSLLPLLRALHACYTEVQRAGARHIESLGLTPCRFDVLAALGDTAGMTVKELGEHALITKGTLLPVIASLEDKGLARRAKSTEDSRQTIVSLTSEGQALYQRTFLVHIDFMRSYLERLPLGHQEQLINLLGEVQSLFASPAGSGEAKSPAGKAPRR